MLILKYRRFDSFDYNILQKYNSEIDDPNYIHHRREAIDQAHKILQRFDDVETVIVFDDETERIIFDKSRQHPSLRISADDNSEDAQRNGYINDIYRFDE